MNESGYDSCISKGACSVNPRTSSLILIIVIYLKIISKYALDIFKQNKLSDSVKELILNASSLIVQSQEITEQVFLNLISEFKNKLPLTIEEYKKIFKEDCFKDEDIQNSDLFTKCNNITDSIKFGEKIFKTTLLNIPENIRDLHQIMLVLAKSLSINLTDYESLNSEFNDAFEQILKLLSSINPDIENEKEIIEIIIKSAIINKDLMLKIRERQEELYGTQKLKKVSYSTFPSKAILVAGSNIRELEFILESMKDSDIDIYTHDGMMLAHTFPKFSEYKNLKGQYGQGGENCLIDFATFPGPIILTKNSLHNIENLYRGRLFTTDKNIPKGVIYIKDNDYSEVLKSAETAKGFKSGKNCESAYIGYDYEKTLLLIKEKVKNLNCKKIVLIGLEKYSIEQKSYFDKLIRTLPKTTLIISFSYNSEKENLLHLNTCFDSTPLLKIYEEIKNYNLPITVFMPTCDRNTISQMIYFSQNKNTRVFVGKCTPIILNPSLMTTLEKDFNIKSITTVSKDVAIN